VQLTESDVAMAGRLLTGAGWACVQLQQPPESALAAASAGRKAGCLVALAVEGGNYFAWRGGDLLLPLTRTPVVDMTGAGDAFTAALIAGLARGYDQELPP
jgi:ribokinase